MNRRTDPCIKPYADSRAPGGGVAGFDRCAAVAVLVGVGVCLLMAGLIGRLGALFGPIGAPRVVVAGGLLCLALGPLVPHRLARFVAPARQGAAAEPWAGARDEALLWAVLAVVALLSGLAIVVLPIWTPAVESGYRWVVVRFLWSGSSLTVVQLLAVVVLTLPGLALAGMTLSCACRLAGGEGAWCVSPLGWAMVGVGVGLGLLQWSGKLGLPGDAASLVAAVPMLLAAVVSAGRLGPRGVMDAPSGWPAPASVPDLSDRHPVLIRLSVVWLAASTGAVVAIWPHVAGRWWGGTMPGGPTMPVLLQAVTAGVGVMVCQRFSSSRSHSAGGLGVACAAGGVGVAVAASVPALRVGGAFLRIGLVSAGAVCGFVMGFALAYGHMAILRRVGHRATGNASLLSATLAAWGVAAFLAHQPNATAVRAYVLMAACAVSLVALGGVTIIHEPTYSARTRRRRLVAVLASIAVMTGVLPMAGRQWAAQTAGQPPAVLHSRNPGGQVAAAETSVQATAAIP